MSRRSICVIGNSGLACVRQAWDELPEERRGGIALTFFAASAYSVGSLELAEGRLVPTDPRVADQFGMTSGGAREIDLGAFDGFVLHGISFEFRDYLRLFCTHAPLEDLPLCPGNAPLSRAGLQAALRGLEQLRPGPRLASLIRGATAAPILLGSAVCPTEAVFEDEKFTKLRDFHDNGLLAQLWHRYVEMASRQAAQQGSPILFQRPGTMAATGLTASSYARGGVGLPQNTVRAIERNELYRTAAERDPWHMNKAFGATVVEDLLATIAPAERESAPGA